MRHILENNSKAINRYLPKKGFENVNKLHSGCLTDTYEAKANLPLCLYHIVAATQASDVINRYITSACVVNAQFLFHQSFEWANRQTVSHGVSELLFTKPSR